MDHITNKLSTIQMEQHEIFSKITDLNNRLSCLELRNKEALKTISGTKDKSENQLKKDAKKKEKEEKFKEKKEKLAAAASSKTNEKPVKIQEKKLISAPSSYTSSTIIGDKKDIQHQLPDAYCPKYVEKCWYDWWEKEGYFKPEIADKYFKIDETQKREIFVMAMPPPNVTGTLHLGHALMCSIEDVLTRWHRALGHRTIWFPGFDHAGIATQVVVEKKLKREKNLTRHDLGRDAFIKEIWKWKDEKGDTIKNQLKRLGCSCDWDRSRFTMDDVSVKAVLEAFIRMHDKGLIYRSKRLVNWSCALNSAISDIEVDKVSVKGRTYMNIPGYSERIEFGTLTSFAYRVQRSIDDETETGEEIIVATTRVETMLGDTAIAVNPKDQRYKNLIGKYVRHPFIHERKIQILSDEMVDPEFGTGAVKITPAHDAYDFDCGKRHNLEFITVIDDRGLITSEGGKFAGMKRFDARKAILKELKNLNLFRGVQDTETILPICSRSKDVIEPLLKSQWYVDCKQMAARACEAVRNKKLKIIPDFHEQVWFKWLEDIHDWCISRQLWWGHRIPAYFIQIEGQAQGDDTDNKYWVSAQSEQEALEKASKRFPDIKRDKIKLHHDEDVLDTWFSSGIFPFSICKWPEETQDLKNFYPGNLLETGHDILFFWVARMVMMGLELTGKLPFEHIYLHAIIRDAHGRKMSKSLGNIIDPLDVIDGITLEELHKRLEQYNLDQKEIEKAIKGQKEDYPSGIPECGTDALRFAMCAYTAQGRDINLDVLRIQGYRHFCNKLWNATKFAIGTGLGTKFVPEPSIQYLKNSKELRKMDRWILSRISETVKNCDDGFRNYELTNVTTSLFNFWLYDLCDYYIEYLKPSFYSEKLSEKQKLEYKNSCEILYTCLDVGLRLISPFMPYISEELYQRLPRRAPDTDPPSICVTWYPIPEDYNHFRNPSIEDDFELTKQAINKIRSLRSDYQLTPKTKTDLYIKIYDTLTYEKMSNLQDLILIMTNSNSISFLKNESEIPPVGCALSTLSDKCKLYIMLKGIIDIDKEEAKLNKKKESLVKQIESIQKEQSRDNYETKVPEDVRQKNKEKLIQLSNEVHLIVEGINQLSSMRG